MLRHFHRQDVIFIDRRHFYSVFRYTANWPILFTAKIIVNFFVVATSKLFSSLSEHPESFLYALRSSPCLEETRTAKVYCCLLAAKHPSNTLAYLKDRSAQTVVLAATLRQRLKIKLSISPSHRKLISGEPDPALTVQQQTPDRVATGVPIFKSLV